MRKQIASLKAPTDIVVRLVTEEVLKICQESVAQVNAGTGSFSLGTALHRHVMFLRTKSTAFLSISIFPCTGPPTTILIGFLGLISNLTLHASHPPFSSLSLHVTNRRRSDRTFHARASLRDRRSDADQQTQGTLNEDRRTGHRAIKYDIPGCCSKGILESCHASCLPSLCIRFIVCLMIGLVMVGHALSLYPHV